MLGEGGAGGKGEERRGGERGLGAAAASRSCDGRCGSWEGRLGKGKLAGLSAFGESRALLGWV